MPLNNPHFDSLFAMTALLNDTELQALANKCQNLIADRERIKRNELRQKLMENLQKAIGDILHNDFCLTIKNTETDPIYDDCREVCFDPEDIYSVEIIDTKQQQCYFNFYFIYVKLVSRRRYFSNT